MDSLKWVCWKRSITLKLTSIIPYYLFCSRHARFFCTVLFDYNRFLNEICETISKSCFPMLFINQPVRHKFTTKKKKNVPLDLDQIKFILLIVQCVLLMWRTNGCTIISNQRQRLRDSWRAKNFIFVFKKGKNFIFVCHLSTNIFFYC